MCEYYGRHGCKQFLRGKPIRFGLKIWCGTTLLVYLIWFNPFQGKSASSRLQDNGLGLGGNLVRHFADVLFGFGRRFFHLCYDNFFNSVKLVTTLKDKLVKPTGTICENRTEKCPLTSNDALKKQGRGKFDFKLTLKMTSSFANGMTIVWQIYAQMLLGSIPYLKLLDILLLKRSKCKLADPFLIKLCNEHMVGVDRMDQMLKYRIAMRSKKLVLVSDFIYA